MGKIEGPISTRLRKMFKASDPVWNPGRPAQPTKAAPVPKGVSGTALGGKPGRHRKK